MTMSPALLIPIGILWLSVADALLERIEPARGLWRRLIAPPLAFFGVCGGYALVWGGIYLIAVGFGFLDEIRGFEGLIRIAAVFAAPLGVLFAWSCLVSLGRLAYQVIAYELSSRLRGLRKSPSPGSGPAHPAPRRRRQQALLEARARALLSKGR